MRISDWSSDVCSSDLPVDILVGIDRRDRRLLVEMAGQRQLQQDTVDRIIGVELGQQRLDLVLRRGRGQTVLKTFHARARKSVVQGKRLAVRVDIGGRRAIKKKQSYLIQIRELS